MPDEHPDDQSASPDQAPPPPRPMPAQNPGPHAPTTNRPSSVDQHGVADSLDASPPPVVNHGPAAQPFADGGHGAPTAAPAPKPSGGERIAPQPDPRDITLGTTRKGTIGCLGFISATTGGVIIGEWLPGTREIAVAALIIIIAGVMVWRWRHLKATATTQARARKAGKHLTGTIWTIAGIMVVAMVVHQQLHWSYQLSYELHMTEVSPVGDHAITLEQPAALSLSGLAEEAGLDVLVVPASSHTEAENWLIGASAGAVDQAHAVHVSSDVPLHFDLTTPVLPPGDYRVLLDYTPAITAPSKFEDGSVRFDLKLVPADPEAGDAWLALRGRALGGEGFTLDSGADVTVTGSIAGGTCSIWLINRDQLEPFQAWFDRRGMPGDLAGVGVTPYAIEHDVTGRFRLSASALPAGRYAIVVSHIPARSGGGGYAIVGVTARVAGYGVLETAPLTGN